MVKNSTNRLVTIFTLMKEFLIVILISVLIFILMNYADHEENQFPLIAFLIGFSIFKVYILISKTLRKMETLKQQNHNVNVILLFSLIIILFINISFTLDFLCVSDIYKDSFSGLNLQQPFIFNFFDLLYFSLVTFTTVGYGDIFPVGKAVKFLTILEMTTAFITIVLIVSKYTNTHEATEKNKE